MHTDAIHPAIPAGSGKRWLAVLKTLLRRRKPRVPPGLSRAQLADAGIAWELAGYGRGADVSMLTITILESQR